MIEISLAPFFALSMFAHARSLTLRYAIDINRCVVICHMTHAFTKTHSNSPNDH